MAKNANLFNPIKLGNSVKLAIIDGTHANISAYCIADVNVGAIISLV